MKEKRASCKDSRVLAETLHSPQALAQREDLARLEEDGGLVHATVDAERDHAAEARGLLFGNQVAGV